MIRLLYSKTIKKYNVNKHKHLKALRTKIYSALHNLGVVVKEDFNWLAFLSAFFLSKEILQNYVDDHKDIPLIVFADSQYLDITAIPGVTK